MAEERVYTINLREAREVPRNKRARKAVHLVREHLERHMKGEVKIGPSLNAEIWDRGMKKPPRKVKVKAVKEDDTVRADTLEAFEEREQQKKEIEEKVKKLKEEKGEETQEEIEGDEAQEDVTEEPEGVPQTDVSVLENSISDAKEAIQEMDDPDYSALLEAEEEGKDRKGMKEWLESQGE